MSLGPLLAWTIADVPGRDVLRVEERYVWGRRVRMVPFRRWWAWIVPRPSWGSDESRRIQRRFEIDRLSDELARRAKRAIPVASATGDDQK